MMRKIYNFILSKKTMIHFSCEAKRNYCYGEENYNTQKCLVRIPPDL